jgi:hypothetical protein
VKIVDLKNLHEEAQALELLNIILGNAAESFTEHGRLPMSAFFITQRNPADGKMYDEACVQALNPKDPAVLRDPHKFSHFVSSIAQASLSIGVLQAFESSMTEVHDGATANDELNELFGESFDEVTDNESVHAEVHDVVVVTFEHLVFSPMTRVWMARVVNVAGKRTLGEWTEETGEGVSAGPMTQYLTYFA